MIDFVKYRGVCFLISLLVLGAGVFGYVKHGGFSYGVDFTGGTEVRVLFDSSIDIAQLRSAVDANDGGFIGTSIQSIGKNDQEFIVKIGSPIENHEIETKFKSLVTKAINTNFKIVSVEHVGPEAGQEVRWGAIWSILLMLLTLLFYIAIRHRYDYAIGAVLALAHDILVLLCFYLLVNEQITLNILAGILTVLGYSLNDTIVVYSRIKENLAHMRGATREEIVNVSINQTLKRTILTSFSTFISVFALYFFGGEVLRGFSLTMMIAVIVGTYSSIYIASPVMLMLSSNKSL